MLLWNGLRNIGSAHSNPTGHPHLPSSLQQILDDRGNLFLSSNTLEERNRARADKSNRCRKDLYLECLCNSRSLLNIDLNKLEGTCLFACELFEGSQQLFRFKRLSSPKNEENRNLLRIRGNGLKRGIIAGINQRNADATGTAFSICLLRSVGAFLSCGGSSGTEVECTVRICRLRIVSIIIHEEDLLNVDQGSRRHHP